jgi:hypothetical protein
MIDWNDYIEWSNGELAGAVYRPTEGTMQVTACEEWTRVTGDQDVVVDFHTGKILGCEDEDYPFIRNKKPAASHQESAQDTLAVSGDR